MPQPPAARHVIFIVRTTLGLSQKDFAQRILNCSGVNLQKVEQGLTPLSRNLALKAQIETDISARWLLENDWSQQPVTPRGDLWTKTLFELKNGLPPGHSYEVHHAVPKALGNNWEQAFIDMQKVKMLSRIEALLEGSRGVPRQGILISRLKQTLDSLEKEFQVDEKTLEKYRPQIEKATKTFEELRNQITELGKARIFRNKPDLEPEKQPRSPR